MPRASLIEHSMNVMDLYGVNKHSCLTLVSHVVQNSHKKSRIKANVALAVNLVPAPATRD